MIILRIRAWSLPPSKCSSLIIILKVKQDIKIVNNMEFYKDLNLISFLKEAGKHIEMVRI